ncbi:MAG TPA: hypothetical protein VN668_06290 [Stellaceae bacterium]|nr:hypothetical protein [Stellaceae bacterium]
MRIIPERVTVIPDAQRSELTVIMEGFRLSLGAEEARALSYALVQGLKQLSEAPGPRAFFSGTPVASAHGPSTAPAAQETPTQKAAEGVRSLSA